MTLTEFTSLSLPQQVSHLQDNHHINSPSWMLSMSVCYADVWFPNDIESYGPEYAQAWSNLWDYRHESRKKIIGRCYNQYNNRGLLATYPAISYTHS